MWMTYATTLGIAAALLVPAYLSPVCFAAVATLGAYRCLIELSRALSSRPGMAARAAYGVAAGGAVALAIVSPAPAAVLAAACAFVLISVAAAAHVGASSASLRAWRAAFVVPVLAAAALSHFAAAPSGFAWILLVYACVEAQDSMAYVFGKAFGRRALLPRVSPNKTVEGAVAGAFSGVAVAGLIAHLLLAQPVAAAAMLGVLLTAAGFCGDVFFSALKRRAGIKDFSAVHASHGGLIDIYDSTLFAALALAAVFPFVRAAG
jgi:CDP-diglyceride synthetase